MCQPNIGALLLNRVANEVESASSFQNTIVTKNAVEGLSGSCEQEYGGPGSRKVVTVVASRRCSHCNARGQFWRGYESFSG